MQIEEIKRALALRMEALAHELIDAPLTYQRHHELRFGRRQSLSVRIGGTKAGIPARDSGVMLIRADQVKSEPISWLWRYWLARAKIHMGELSEGIAKMQRPALIVVDPLVSAIAGDSHNNAETRRGLQPLADLAIERRVAVLGIHHLSKGTQGRKPLERITGSLAFGALARIVFFAARGEGEAEGERLFVRGKSNIGPIGDGFRYSLEQAPLADDPEISASGIVWGEAVKGTAAELLAKLEGLEPGKGDSPAMSEAKGFLQDRLAAGSILQKAIKAEAEGAGISWATVRRAKDALGVQAEKAPAKPGADSPWQWRLPEREP